MEMLAMISKKRKVWSLELTMTSSRSRYQNVTYCQQRLK